MQRSHLRLQIATLVSRSVLIGALTVSSLAAAQAVPTIGAGSDGKNDRAAYRGTSVSYGHQLSAYNYTEETVSWSHRVGLMPEYHFGKQAFVRARLYLSQEFTLSDSTNTRHEVELSDLWLDGVWGGWTEKNTGLRLAGDLRATFPTSKGSQAASRLFTLGPSANLSRHFNVLAGLTFIYSGRFTWRFNQFTTRQNAGGRIVNCAGLNVPELCIDTATGARNVQADVIHGPTISFSPHERLNVSATFLMQHGWLSPLSATPPELAGIEIPDTVNTASVVNTRDFTAFSFGVTYTPWDVVSFTLGAFSFQTQRDTEGNLVFPLFNRSTVVSLDATFDIEAAISSFTKEKS